MSEIDRSYVKASDGDLGPEPREVTTDEGTVTFEAVRCNVCGDEVPISDAIHIHIDPYERECPNRLCAETHPYPYETRFLCRTHSAVLLDYMEGPELEHRVVRAVRCDRRFVRACWVTAVLIICAYVSWTILTTVVL